LKLNSYITSAPYITVWLQCPIFWQYICKCLVSVYEHIHPTHTHTHTHTCTQARRSGRWRGMAGSGHSHAATPPLHSLARQTHSLVQRQQLHWFTSVSHMSWLVRNKHVLQQACVTTDYKHVVTSMWQQASMCWHWRKRRIRCNASNLMDWPGASLTDLTQVCKVYRCRLTFPVNAVNFIKYACVSVLVCVVYYIYVYIHSNCVCNIHTYMRRCVHKSIHTHATHIYLTTLTYKYCSHIWQTALGTWGCCRA
jgi:hypothetical protein